MARGGKGERALLTCCSNDYLGIYSVFFLSKTGGVCVHDLLAALFGRDCA